VSLVLIVDKPKTFIGSDWRVGGVSGEVGGVISETSLVFSVDAKAARSCRYLVMFTNNFN